MSTPNKWCPFARVTTHVNTPAYNRRIGETEIDNSVACIEDKCACWIQEQVMVPGKDGGYTHEATGWCGLTHDQTE